MSKDIVLECRNLSKTFADGKHGLKILQDINLQVPAGSQVAIVGKSGSGKTTMLQLLGGLDNPTSGTVFVSGKDIMALNQTKRGLLRNQEVGFIYQMHHLLPEFTALENIAMPLLIAKRPVKEALSKAEELLAAVGLSERSSHRPAKLSGGERQRVAIARSLVTEPDLVLADEPTGNLDQENANMAFELMCDLNRKSNTSFVIVTHDMDLAQRMDIIYQLQDGVLNAYN